MIQIRNVPCELHRRLKARAAEEGISMSDFVLREIRESLAVPSRAAWFASWERAPVRELRPSAATTIRKLRGQ